MKKEKHSSIEGLTASHANASEKRTAHLRICITALAMLTLSSTEDDKIFPPLLPCFNMLLLCEHILTSHQLLQQSAGTGKYSVYAAIYQKVKNFPFQPR